MGSPRPCGASLKSPLSNADDHVCGCHCVRVGRGEGPRIRVTGPRARTSPTGACCGRKPHRPSVRESMAKLWTDTGRLEVDAIDGENTALWGNLRNAGPRSLRHTG